MNRRSLRRGFSLPEVLVAVVLLGVIGGALTKLVVSQMRFFDNVTTTRSARSVARNAMNVVLADLRMVQAEDGVTAATSTSITVNVPYTFGVYCGNTGVLSTVSMMPTDSATLAFAKFAGYAYRGTGNGAAFTPVASLIPPVTSAVPAICTGSASGQAMINTMTINGRVGKVLDITPILPVGTVVGTPVYFYQTVTYSFAASTMFPGKIGLWRNVAGGVNEELMAPFASSAHFQFYVAGANASTTTVPTLGLIRGLDLYLTAVAPRKAAGQSAESQSRMVTSVFFKNVRTP